MKKLFPILLLALLCSHVLSQKPVIPPPCTNYDGVGTASPSAKWHVHQDCDEGGVAKVLKLTSTASPAGLRFNLDGTNALIKHLNGSGYLKLNNGSTSIQLNKNADLVFNNNLKIDNNGQNIILDNNTRLYGDPTQSKLTFNSYWNGTNTVRVSDGPASMLHFWDGDIHLTTAETGSAESTIDWNTGITIKKDGTVGIGVASPSSDYKLEVAGPIRSCAVRVETTYWCDYVFDNDYGLMSLPELEQYIKINKHLPEVPTTEQVMEEGIDLAEMNALLLKKVEELTLYIIEVEKRLKKLEK